MATGGVKITGDKRVLGLLRELPGRVGRKVNRRAVNLATTPILAAAKAEVPVDHGDLKRAQIKKVTSRGMNANGIVGADANYVGSGDGGGRLSKEDAEAIKAAGGDLTKPAKYDHLVEYGHATRGGGQTTPNPYLARAWEGSIGTARAKYETELAAGVEREAAELGGG